MLESHPVAADKAVMWQDGMSFLESDVAFCDCLGAARAFDFQVFAGARQTKKRAHIARFAVWRSESVIASSCIILSTRRLTAFSRFGSTGSWLLKPAYCLDRSADSQPSRSSRVGSFRLLCAQRLEPTIQCCP